MTDDIKHPEDIAEAAQEVIDLIEADGHEVRTWAFSADGTLSIDIEPSGIGGGTVK